MKNEYNHLSERKSESGLTLIQMSIILMVVGLLLVPVLEIYNINKIERLRRENNQKIENVAIALNKYAQHNKKFPVPAVPTQLSSNANYGKAAVQNPAQACSAVLGAVGIRCIRGPAGATAPTRDVLVGAVPFRDIGLKEADTYDIYGAKITYAISRNLVETSTFRNDQGAIGMLNQQSTVFKGGGAFNSVDKNNRPNVLFVVISHGADRKGAYQRNGTLTACTVAGMDRDNCNRNGMQATFRGIQKVDPDDPNLLLEEVSKSYSLAAGTGYYDDMITSRNTAYDEYWSGLSESVTSDENVFNSEPVQTAIRSPTAPATAADMPKAMLDVEGNVQAYRAITETLCDISGSASGSDRCFRVRNITSPSGGEGSVDSGVKCEADTALNGFVTGEDQTQTPNRRSESSYFIKRKCTDDPRIPASEISPSACPNGIRGWSTEGNPICIP